MSQKDFIKEAFQMGAINKVVPHKDLENVALEWAREMNTKSPTAMRMYEPEGFYQGKEPQFTIHHQEPISFYEGKKAEYKIH